MNKFFRQLPPLLLLLLCKVAFTENIENAKPIFFVLHKRSDYAVDWKRLRESGPQNAIWVLIGNRDSIEPLTAEARKNFAEVKIIDDLDFDAAQRFIDGVLTRYYREGDYTNIAAISEFDITLAAQLRDYFRNAYRMQGPGDEVMNNFRNKIAMKSWLRNTDITIPRYQQYDWHKFDENRWDYFQSLEKDLGFPMFIKPVDGAASIDTSYIANKRTLERWCISHAFTLQEYEIDQFIEGELYHCDSVIKDGEIRYTFVSKYLHPNAEARHEKAIGSITLDPKSEDHKNLSEFAAKALRHFPSLPDGLTHLEVFKALKGELVFLEVAARPAGAQVPEMYHVRTGGIDIRLLHLKLVFGFNVHEELEHLQGTAQWGPYAAMYQKINPSDEQVIKEINNPTIESQHKTLWKCAAGDSVSPNHSISDLLFSTILWNTDLKQLESDFYRLDNQEIIVWKEQSPSPEVQKQLDFWVDPLTYLGLPPTSQPQMGMGGVTPLFWPMINSTSVHMLNTSIAIAPPGY